MTKKSDDKRLAEAVENLAATITEIIESKIRTIAEATEPIGEKTGGIDRLTPTHGWVGKKEAAAHLKISLRILGNWMKKGLIPYIRIGRGVRLKLSEIDEAMNRRDRVEARY